MGESTLRLLVSWYFTQTHQQDTLCTKLETESSREGRATEHFFNVWIHLYVLLAIRSALRRDNVFTKSQSIMFGPPGVGLEVATWLTIQRVFSDCGMDAEILT